jgi:polar amino acid transport system substrate-binding protein
MTEVTSTLRAEFAPTGTLRVALNMSNFLLTRKDPATGEAAGVAPDMGKELARRLGVPVQLVQYDSPGKVADAAKTGVWDVGFIGAEPQRANEMDFSAAYVEIEATYLLPPGSPLQSIDEVDRKGVRIAISERSAYDLYLTRSLKHAELVRMRGADEVFKRFVADKLDALAGLRPRLITDHANLPGSRILDGNFTAVQQAAGTPKGRPAAFRYLCEFIEDAKASGLVAKLIESNKVRGLTVAPKA